MLADFLEAVKQALKNSEQNKALSECKAPFTINQIQFYYHSYNYYLLPIRHLGQTEAPNWDSFGRYGAVRNNQYSIHINTILGFCNNLFPSEMNVSRITEKLPLAFSLSVSELTQHTIEADLE